VWRLWSEHVGLVTGDAAVNSDARILVGTAEILSNMALRRSRVPADFVVMDEFHYYGDRERGIAWQIPLCVLKQATFLLMSATLGDTTVIEKKTRRVHRSRGGQRTRRHPACAARFRVPRNQLHETTPS